jgi:hypothetical protein
MKHARILHALLLILVLSFGTALAAPPPSEVWVDHDWTGPGDCGGHSWHLDAFSAIGEGVEAVAEGGAVYVAGGIYEEQVVIGTNEIRLIGLGSSGDPTVIAAPALLDQVFHSGPIANRSILSVVEATGVSILNITVNGLDRGFGIDRFIGIAFWNADGLVSESRIVGVRHWPITEQYSGIGVYAGNNGGGPYEVSVQGTLITTYQANGILLTGHGLTFSINGCILHGVGPNTEIGQTGVEILDGPIGRIADCHVESHQYTGTEGLVGTAYRIDNSDGAVELSHGCTSLDDQVGVLFRNSNGAIRETVVSHFGDSRRGIIVQNTRIPRPASGGIRPLGEDSDGFATRPMTVEVTGCDVGGHGVTGIEVISEGGALNALLVGNRVHNWETGVLVDGAADPVVHAYGNRFYENTYSNAVDNGVSPPSLWSYAPGAGPGNYWDHYAGTSPLRIDGAAGATDYGPNPTATFNLRTSTALINCSGKANLTISLSPVACMRGYDLLFEYDPTRWGNPTFTNVLPLGELGEVEAQFSAYAVGSGKWRVTHAIVGHTSGFASAVPVDVCQISLAPKSGAPQGSSSFGLGTRYGSVDYPTIVDAFDDEIDAYAGTGRPAVAVDCSAPVVGFVAASGEVRSGMVPQIVIGGSETPANGGRVTKLWYQYRSQGQPCSATASSWRELAAVSLPSGNWNGGQAFAPPTVPDFIGPCTMYVMAEDAAGNKGYCAGASSVTFNYGPASEPPGDGDRESSDGTVPPGHYHLGDAAPNPFGGRTTIQFTLPLSSPVRLVVYDVAGRVVRTLVDETVPAGYHATEWDGRDDAGRTLVRGIYFYRLDAGTFHSQKRVLLLK